MLTLYHDNKQYPLENTEYYIRELANGLDECNFMLNIHDPIYAIIAEEENIVDRAGQTYKVKQIDAGVNDASIVCQLDLDVWKASLHVDYNSGTKTVYQQINAIKPNGWSIVDKAHINIGRTIEGDYTPYDICVECTSVYNVYIRWDNKLKTVTIYPKAMSAPVGAFATKELNLKEINYKGKSNSLITRLYAYGKDGLSFADINNNKAYVENFNYTSRVICGIWRDERYEVKENLLADATEKLAVMAKPDRTYECSIVDLQATNPELYNNLDFSIFTTATLIDDVKDTAIDYQVVERHIYPYHPEMNAVIFNSEPLKITKSVIDITDAIDNPNSTFQQIQAQKITNATAWLTSGEGYVVAVKGSNGQWSELLFMDTDDESTAQNVLRINTNGLGFSTTGINGPYTNAWTIDGNLVADFITTGHLLADRIQGGTLMLGGKLGSTEDYYGICSVKDASNTERVRLDKNGIKAVRGYIGNGSTGWTIADTDIHNGCTGLTNTTAGTYIGTTGIRNQGSSASDYTTITGGKITSTTVELTGKITATSGYIGGSTGWTISSTDIHNGCNSITSTTNGTYVGTNGFRNVSGSNIATITGGQITANNVSLTGSITATSGYIGGTTGWVIDTGKIYNGCTSISSNANGTYVGTNGFRNVSDNSKTTITGGKITSNDVDLTGAINATSGTFTGTVNAKTGYIGNGSTGWTIANTAIYNGLSTINGTTAGTYVGTDGFANYADANSYTRITGGKITSNNVDLTGTINATSGSFTGTVTATSGSFTGTVTATSGYIGNYANGWTIANTAIYNGLSSVGGTSSGTYLGTDGFANYSSGSSYTRITGGKITSNNVDLTGAINATSGSFSGTVNASSGTFNGTVNASGGYFQSGYFGTGGNWEITTNGLHTKNGPTAPYGQYTQGTYVGSDGFCCNGASSHVWISGGAITTDGAFSAGGITANGTLILNSGVAVNSGGSSYTGASGTITFPADTSGSRYCYLTVTNGIVTAIGTT